MPENDLGKAGAQVTVRVGVRKAERTERKVAQLGERVVRRRVAAANALEELAKGGRIHGRPP